MASIDRSWKQQLKPIAALLGITSSRIMWQRMALQEYRRKRQMHIGFRQWCESEAPRWVTEHWGHTVVKDEFEEAHLTSQLYEVAEKLRSRIGPCRDVHVLDAGASDGFFLTRLGAIRGVGVNFLPACSQKIKMDGFTTCVADIEYLPFSNKAFDYVICCETLEHVSNPIRVLNELARVCARRVYLTIPWVPHTRINRRPDGWPDVESHIFEFSEEDFAKVLTHARVKVAYQDRIQVFPEPHNMMVQWWFSLWMYPSFFPKLQYYELEPS